MREWFNFYFLLKEREMERKTFLIILLFAILVGCSSAPDIYVDGMPVSDHEYTAVTKEGLKTSFVLTRYYEKQFDNETMIYPAYLDLFEKANKIDSDQTKQLILHIKIVNIRRTPIIVWWRFHGPHIDFYKMLYNGKLPRKDLSVQMPIAEIGKFEYEVAFAAHDEELFRIWGEYETRKGG
jgi:hypothetical protein